MKNKALITAIGTIALLAGGCVPMERELRVDQDILSLKSRLNSLEQGVDRQGQNRESIERQVEGMARRQADLQASQDALRVELQTVRGLIDDATARRREEQENLLLTQKDAGLRLGNMDGRLLKVEKDLLELRTLQSAKVTEPAVAAENLYEQGRDLILNKGDGSKGRATLEEFIKARPQSELVPNAYYWIGESYYSEKNFENAIVQFQDVIEKYPAHSKASASLYKQALAFESLGEGRKATALLKKLIDTYPASDEAKKAKERAGGKPKS
ncbi:MAG: tol-pal system protein YbgF [Desulfuromonadales bacterium]|nr:tol-pal system protein YbgF [Desulfuromonadales bacterium]